jgi:hypothetical protein
MRQDQIVAAFVRGACSMHLHVLFAFPYYNYMMALLAHLNRRSTSGEWVGLWIRQSQLCT